VSDLEPESDRGVAQRVCAVVGRCEDVDASGLSQETRLASDLGMDSLSQVELQMALEDEFGVELPDADVSGLETIGDVVTAVAAAIRRAGRATAGLDRR
jgi:acyl carrier protein